MRLRVHMQIDKFFATAKERYLIKLRRESGQPYPWTTDPVFGRWFFCNVHREDDRTTRWFAENIRSKLEGLPLLHATLIFRQFNRIETIEGVLDLILNGWDSSEARARLQGERPLVTGAYMLKTPTNMNKLDGTLWIIDHAIPMLTQMYSFNPWQTLQDAWKDLKRIPFIGPFLAYEIVSDLRWTHILCNSSDIMTWANFGPGATHGLGRVFHGYNKHFDRNSSEDQEIMNSLARKLLDKAHQHWPSEWRPWEMREVEHWLCEYDKYCRGEANERLKRRYRP